MCYISEILDMKHETDFADDDNAGKDDQSQRESEERLAWGKTEDSLVGKCQFRCRAGKRAGRQHIRRKIIERGLLSWATMWRLSTRGEG